MTTELATSSAPVVAVRGDELQVSAATPNEMAQSQDALIEWAKRKVALTEEEAHELHAAFRVAVDRKWKSTTTTLNRNRCSFDRAAWSIAVIGFDAWAIITVAISGIILGAAAFRDRKRKIRRIVEEYEKAHRK